MKITGGQFKSRTIKVPKNPNIRPSTEKTREAIFSSLGTDVLNSSVADLFCGSGALGIEAISRGAANALFVDVNPGSTAIVRENIRTLGIDDLAKVMTMNVFDLRPRHLKDIGIIFADPPYSGNYNERLLSLLSLQKFDWHGILIMEHESGREYKSPEVQLLRRLEFGDSAVSLLLRMKQAGEPL